MKYFVSFFLIACTGIKLIGEQNYRHLYSDKFLASMDDVKSLYEQEKYSEALDKLRVINTKELLPTEVALFNFWIGSIMVKNDQIDQAINFYVRASTNASLDPTLSSLVSLKLAAAYASIDATDKALVALSQVIEKYLKREDLRDYALIAYQAYGQNGQYEKSLEYLVKYLGHYKTIDELTSDEYYRVLLETFNGLTGDNKINFLNRYRHLNLLVVNYLGYLATEEFYQNGNTKSAKDLAEWLVRSSRDYPDILNPLNELLTKMGAKTKPVSFSSSSSKIGVLLPLSGDRRQFGIRALSGIDFRFQEYLAATSNNYGLVVLDSEGSGVTGALRVKELIEKHKVAAIIGGLFSDEAEKEYLVAKEKGVFFVSLAELMLDSSVKDSKLLEIPGSIESQVDFLVNPNNIAKFGSRVAVVHPKNNQGRSYFDYFYKEAAKNNVTITGVISYNVDERDYRQSIRKLLGIELERERTEELELYTQLDAVQKRRGRTTSTIPAVVDFDWVFMPGLPKNAIQIIPAFAYYDVNNVKFVGIPSWRSETFARDGERLRNVYFASDDLPSSPQMNEKFFEKYQKNVKVIELRAYDAMKIVDSLMVDGAFQDDSSFRSATSRELEGTTGRWQLKNGLWIKKLERYRFHLGKILAD